jgi:hypothetical protein
VREYPRNSLGTRDALVAVIMKAVLAILVSGLLIACATKPLPGPSVAPLAPTETSTAALTSAEADPATLGCELVCEGARIDGVDYHAAAVADANRVIGTMHDDLLACYKNRLVTHPRAHASLTFDVVIEPDGTDRRVDTTGGAMLGDKALRCMTDRIQRGVFAPVHGGGTLRVHVPMTFRTTQNL